MNRGWGPGAVIWSPGSDDDGDNDKLGGGASVVVLFVVLHTLNLTLGGLSKHLPVIDRSTLQVVKTGDTLFSMQVLLLQQTNEKLVPKSVPLSYSHVSLAMAQKPALRSLLITSLCACSCLVCHPTQGLT